MSAGQNDLHYKYFCEKRMKNKIKTQVMTEMVTHRFPSLAWMAWYSIFSRRTLKWRHFFYISVINYQRYLKCRMG